VQGDLRRYREQLMMTQATVDRRNGVRDSRWQRQDGFLRGVITFAVIIVVVAVLVLDAIAVINAQLGVRQNATDAANQALSNFVLTSNPAVALDSASAFLKIHGSVMIRHESKLTPSAQGPGQATVTIAAFKKPNTYVLHYFQSLPGGMGRWFHKILNPHAVETNG